MPATTNPARPRTQADIEALVVDGVRDIRRAALFLGVSPRSVRRMVTGRELWTFKLGGKRVIPVVELRRVLLSHAMDELA